MTTATLPCPAAPASTGSIDIDSRAAYTSFGLAYVLGHGASAVSSGPDPLIALPPWLPDDPARHRPRRRRRRVRRRGPPGDPPARSPGMIEPWRGSS
jgi:hypothetical protein